MDGQARFVVGGRVIIQLALGPAFNHACAPRMPMAPQPCRPSPAGRLPIGTLTGALGLAVAGGAIGGEAWGWEVGCNQEWQVGSGC